VAGGVGVTGPREHVDLAMLGLSIDAFNAARRRVSTAAVTADQMFAPLTEAAWWAICVDEELELVPGYKSARNKDPNGQVVIGLSYARSALGHHRFFAARLAGGGLPISARRPTVISPLYAVWVDVDDLPEFPSQSTKRPFYARHLAGHSVAGTFESADDWFTRCWGQMQ
jgi:hypothetical protein